jgi:hypothetical protein
MSLKKIFSAIIGVMFLINLKAILRALEPAYFWFCDSLDGLRDFDEGAQAAIAVLMILAAIVLTMKIFNKF